MFNLFMVMNADLSYVSPFLDEGIIPKWVIGLFMIMSNWAIFSILTAVVSDNMATVSADAAEERAAHEAELKEKDCLHILNKLFDNMDTDQSGTITQHDFKQLLDDDIRSNELQEATGM